MVRYSDLRGFYDVEKTIGCGGFAKVKLATHVATGDKVAIKIMEKSRLGDDLPRVKLELSALKALSHRHICRLYQVLETDSHFFLVVEYCPGGELFDHIVEKNRLPEDQSRVFFRQIISAVAYLHSLGYAHRDLKPENILLSSDQSLKLIDFGLCAKPERGIRSPLSTSCGSPAYAAPELVLGRQYLGPEVDVWSMGVLLYAILCGCLPFDDQNIDNLYKKILNGKYYEPSFLSKSSRDFIRRMLQIDPKKRITVTEMLSHPWVTEEGQLKAVECQAENSKQQDEDCVVLMAQYHKIDAEVLWQDLCKWRYDYNTATYLLLHDRKRRGLLLQLNPVALQVPIGYRKKFAQQKRKRISSRSNNNENEEVFNPVGTFVEPCRSSSIRKPLKRIRSPTLEADNSPVPAKKAATALESSARTPDRKKGPESAETPGSARRVFNSIEKSFHRMRQALTPKKVAFDQPALPAILTNKDMCNVSTTQCSDPEHVINHLLSALQNKGMQCKRKGFTLRGKMEPDLSRRLGGCSFELEVCYLPSLTSSPKTSCSTSTKSILKNFSAPTNRARSGTVATPRARGNVSEPTVLVPLATVGIRRKRLKGDSWCYKRVCEEVLALTASDSRRADSAV